MQHLFVFALVLSGGVLIAVDAHGRFMKACFNQNVLRIAGGGPGSGTTKLPAGPTGLMRSKLQLPSGVRCNHCIIQWNYRAGNNWGDCGNGTSATGCGPQETFRGCSDIRIR
ncbi:hypothetical protein Fcan01_26167 [Folsomia candida]|uniref:Chitin-binding type-4 domain-containing protein n=1 Tax=Folsomia candida TaxID=158441 RepID=A0A226D314_FOLCA|nr:hypothetical protein Fcan01_26167 [Folsomia candida]